MSTDLRIGVAGLGAIGRTHINRIATTLQGARVVAGTDMSPEFGAKTAGELGLAFFKTVDEMLSSDTVDALMVTAADGDHEHFVSAGVRAGVPVFCEKPLAPDADACRRIIDLEMAGGKRLVQVGFMRRYDPGYRELKGLLDGGQFGAPLMVYSTHRNFAVDERYDTPMAISNTMIHDIDVLRWLVGEDYATVEMAIPRQTKYTHAKLLDPQVMILTSQSGIRIQVECFVNCRVGYDIQCEVCCEEGFLRLPDPAAVHRLVDASRVTPICRDWSERFVSAYNTEIQAWINAARAGRPEGPSSWDGLTAIVVADAAQRARDEGKTQAVAMPEKPAFYA